MKRTFTILEIAAVAFSLTYTLLLTYQIVWCWLFALLASLLYLYLCFIKRIYAESALQLFYLATAVYGWLHWQETGGLIESFLPWTYHLIIILAGGSLVLITGLLLRKLTDAAKPFVDSFTTVFAVFGTLLMINLYPDNWYYWIVIDAVSVYLYLKREMYLTAMLFGVYTLLAVNGLLEWMS